MFTKSSEYAIRALVFIQLQNWKQLRPKIVEISKEIESPNPYTAKILQILSKHKLVNSAKGRGGGFFFNREQPSPSLHEVIKVMEEGDIFNKCGFGLKSCSDENPCPLHDKYVSIRNGVYDMVHQETIATLSTKIIQGKAIMTRTGSIL